MEHLRVMYVLTLNSVNWARSQVPQRKISQAMGVEEKGIRLDSDWRLQLTHRMI